MVKTIFSNFCQSFKDFIGMKWKLLIAVILDILFVLGALLLWKLYVKVVVDNIVSILEFIQLTQPTLEKLYAGTLQVPDIYLPRRNIIIATLFFGLGLFVLTSILLGISWYVTKKKARFLQYIKRFALFSLFYYFIITFMAVMCIFFFTPIFIGMAASNNLNIFIVLLLVMVFLITYYLIINFSIIDSKTIMESLKKSWTAITSGKIWLSFLLLMILYIILYFVIDLILHLSAKVNYVFFLIIGFILIFPLFTYARIYINNSVKIFLKN